MFRIVASLGVAASLCGVARADTIRVPQDQTSINAAIGVANPGDVILVDAGTYAESVLIDSKSDITVKGSGKVRIQPPAGPGITVSGSNDITLTKLVVEDAEQQGIKISDSSPVLVSKCTVLRSGSAGVEIQSASECTVTKCRIERAGGDGVLANKASAIRVSKNRIVESSGDGVAFSAGGPNEVDDSFIQKNVIDTTGEDGIEVRGDNNVVEKNKISDCNASALLQDLAGPMSMTGNVFSKNRVTDCSAAGFAFGDTNTWEKNRAKRVETGFFVTVGSQGIVFERNRVTKAFFDGFNVSGLTSDTILTRNKAKRCGDDGFQVSGSEGTYENNTASRSGENGFEVGGIQNVFTGNKASKSGNFDALDSSGGMNDYTDNQFGTTSGI